MSGPVSHNLNCAMPDRIFRPNTRPTHAMIIHGYKLSPDFGMVPRGRQEMMRDAMQFCALSRDILIAKWVRENRTAPIVRIGLSERAR